MVPSSRLLSSLFTVTLACWISAIQGRRVHVVHDTSAQSFWLSTHLLGRPATKPSETFAALLLARSPALASNTVRSGSRVPFASISAGRSRQEQPLPSGAWDNLPASPRRAPRAPAADMYDPTLDPRSEEYDETKDFLLTFGKYIGLCFGTFFVMTEYLGVETETAGNLVFFVLCSYATYLLFFDGGVTKNALENQAVAQIANEEAFVMEEAKSADVNAFSSNEVLTEPLSASKALEEEGYVRINNVLSPETTNAVLEHINSNLKEKFELAKDDLNVETRYFGNVMMRQERYDFYLDLDPIMRNTVEEALKPIKPVFESLLGSDAELFELAALVADPRAPRQPVHPDNPFVEGEGAIVATAYIALQDIDLDMGPTSFIPRTNTGEVHERFNTPDDGYRAKMDVLREYPNHVGLLKNGDANLIDSRLLHCGGENESKERRVLLYFSFKSAKKPLRSGSIKYELRSAGFRLNNTAEWLSENAKVVPTR